MKKTSVGAICQQAAEKGWDLDMGPTDPEHTRPSGGVGLMVRKPWHSKQITGRTKAYNDAVATGRAAIYELDLQTAVLQIAVVYG